ncbi:MAG: ATP synthase F1 subunit delta [Candidatus Marinimicrobia bacterium]|nr:ATP synthase F1 subunit delta [Candidatus Neomarinimicrobiota bacterium]
MAGNSEARRFAKAAYRLAAQQGVPDSFVERFRALASMFRQNRAFRHVIVTHRIPVKEKMAVLRSALAEGLSAMEFGVLHLLLERKLGIQLPHISKALLRMAQRQGLLIDLHVTTPREQTSKELAGLRERIGGETGRSLRVSSEIDPSLVGGIKLRLGNLLVDGSLARRLALLRRQLV